MQSPYNGIFLKSETAALLCNHMLKLVLDVFKPVFIRCGKDPDIMKACMEAVPTQFSEEMYEKYTRQLCNKHRDFTSLICDVIKQMAFERHGRDGKIVVIEASSDVVGKVFVKRFLISMAASESVVSGRIFDPMQTVECTLVTQSITRDCLWGIADEFVRLESIKDDISEVSSVSSVAIRKKHKKKKHRRQPSEVSSVSSVSKVSTAIVRDYDNNREEHDVDAWGEVDDDVDPLDSVSQVFASTDNRSSASVNDIKYTPHMSNTYTPPPIINAPPPPPPPPSAPH